MEYIEFNNGIKMPLLGFGTYRIAPYATQQAVSKAIKIGYQSIDTAQLYGNEAGVGKAINESSYSRDHFFITSKVKTSGYRATRQSIDLSLQRAGLDYFDLMLIHWPMGKDLDTYRALEEAYQAGKLRSIGVSNFNHQQINELLANFATTPVVDQIETSVYLQQQKMHRYLEEHYIIHESWSPLRRRFTNYV